MKIVTAFYDGQLLHEYDPGTHDAYWDHQWPDGAYFYNKHQRNWYLQQNGTTQYIPNIEDVPAVYRTLLLLLTSST